MLVISLAALATLPFIGAGIIAWAGVGACVAGLIVLVVTLALPVLGVPGEPKRRGAAALPVKHFFAFRQGVSDHPATAPAPPDAVAHDDHMMERDLIAKDEVVIPDEPEADDVPPPSPASG
jgi:hypothetical protein